MHVNMIKIVFVCEIPIVTRGPLSYRQDRDRDTSRHQFDFQCTSWRDQYSSKDILRSGSYRGKAELIGLEALEDFYPNIQCT